VSLSLKSLFLKKDIPASGIPIEELTEEELRTTHERDFGLNPGMDRLTRDQLLESYRLAKAKESYNEL
tara:strand:- start:42 stop:245 length:204 start_codon:yes stop_codon:yes gene_type:complete